MTERKMTNPEGGAAQEKARRLKALREYVGYSQQQIASFLGRKVSEVQKVESGESPVRLEDRDLLAFLYGLEPARIFKGDDMPSPMFCPLFPAETTLEEMKAYGQLGVIVNNSRLMEMLLEKAGEAGKGEVPTADSAHKEE